MRSTARLVATLSARPDRRAARPFAGGLSRSRSRRLGADLTPLGGEKAGNADGTIPPGTAASRSRPPATRPASTTSIRSPADKPLFTITQQNAGQYAAKLSEGHKAMLKAYPSFKMNVYPTRRRASAPQRIYDATARNAGTAKLVERRQRRRRRPRRPAVPDAEDAASR